MRLVYDIESNGFDPKPEEVWCIVAYDIDTGTLYQFTDQSDKYPSMMEGLQLLSNAKELIGHNIIGFDSPLLDAKFGTQLFKKKSIDTLVMSRVLNQDREGGHGLAAWGKRLGNDKIEFDEWDRYSEEMMTYCVQDVMVNVDVYNKLMEEFAPMYKRNPMIAKGLEVEHDVEKFNQFVKRRGWAFDRAKARLTLTRMNNRMKEIEDILEPQLGLHKVYKDKEPIEPKYKKNGEYTGVSARQIGEYLGQEVSTTDTHLMKPGTKFRRSSMQQIKVGSLDLVKDWLLDQGWVPDEYEKKKVKGRWVNGSPKFTHSSMVKFGEIADLLPEYLTIRSRRSILEGWIEESENGDGRIHGDMRVIGTPTFRCTHKNIVNLPGVDAAWGKEVRELLIADGDWQVVGADSSGNQLRALCHYVRNPEFTNEMINGDQHQKNADNLGCDRPTAKTYLYAYLFGAGDAKLGQILTGKYNATIGAKSRDNFAKGIQGLKELGQSLEDKWNKTNYHFGKGLIMGLDGRFIWVSKNYQALNYLLQTTEGITCKAAVSYAMHKIKKENLRAEPRLMYHDEQAWVAHPDDAHRVGEILQESFEEAPKWFGVECMNGGDYVIGKSYADVH